MSLLSFPLFPWLNSTQYCGQLKVCVFMCPWVNVTPDCSLSAYMLIQPFLLKTQPKKRSYLTWVSSRTLFCLLKALYYRVISSGQTLSNERGHHADTLKLSWLSTFSYAGAKILDMEKLLSFTQSQLQFVKYCGNCFICNECHTTANWYIYLFFETIL